MVVTNPANMGPDISFKVIFLNKQPKAAPNKTWIAITNIYMGIASTISKIWTNADNIIGPIIVGPGIFNLTATYHPRIDIRNTNGNWDQL